MHAPTAFGLLAVTLAIAGCGSTADYANEPRPPAPINVAAAITPERVTVSPDRFGGGPIVLIVANQTDEPRRVTLETDVLGADGPGLKQTTGPINPDGTGTLKVDMPEGEYELSVDGNRIAPARIEVGESRESAQNQLLQP